MDQPINILIVDDEPKNLTVLETVLDDPGYRLVRAQSADEALLALVEEEFALLILDIRMPDMTGFELAQLVKERKKTAQVPIIFLTAYYNEDQHVLEGYVAGAVDYMQKPVNAAILRWKVAVFAELHRKQREVAIANRALLAEVEERRRAEERLRELNETLEQRVVERTSALRESEERMRLAVDAAQMGSWDWNLLTGQIIWTPRHAVMYGYEPDDSPRTEADFRKALHPEDVDRVIAAVEQSIRQGSDYHCEYRVVWGDGSVHWMSGSGSFHRDADGRAVRMLGMIVDITEQKQAAEYLLRAKEAAEAANAAKDHFLAVLSHELRTPLTPVLVTAQMLEADQALSPEHHELVKMIRCNAELEARLIDDLLDVTRISRGKLELRTAPTDLHEMIRQVIEMCAEDLRDKALSLETDLMPDEPVMEVDPARFQQILWNLLKNSIKFTPSPGRIRLQTARNAAGRVVITVSDTGIGIEAGLLPHVFDAFEQGPRDTFRQFGGLGLGLAISKSLVDMHGGTISAASAGHGQGATFTVEMPAGASGKSASRAPGRNGQAKLSCSILLVEDHPDSRQVLTRLLKNMGCSVKSAGTVAEALEIAASQRFDLLISDIGLPDATGLDLMRQLRARFGLKGVALSGYGSDKDLASSEAAGFAAHMTKPVNIRALEETVRRLTNQAS